MSHSVGQVSLSQFFSDLVQFSVLWATVWNLPPSLRGSPQKDPFKRPSQNMYYCFVCPVRWLNAMQYVGIIPYPPRLHSSEQKAFEERWFYPVRHPFVKTQQRGNTKIHEGHSESNLANNATSLLWGTGGEENSFFHSAPLSDFYSANQSDFQWYSK